MIDKLISMSKIAFALIASYLTVTLFSGVFFVGNSPSLRSHPEQYIALRLDAGVHSIAMIFQGNTAKKTQPLISADKYREFISSAAAKSMKRVTTGTYAATVEGKNVEIIKLNEIPMKEYTYTLKSGKQIKVRVPVDSSPPSQAEVEE